MKTNRQLIQSTFYQLNIPTIYVLYEMFEYFRHFLSYFFLSKVYNIDFEKRLHQNITKARKKSPELNKNSVS